MPTLALSHLRRSRIGAQVAVTCPAKLCRRNSREATYGLEFVPSCLHCSRLTCGSRESTHGAPTAAGVRFLQGAVRANGIVGNGDKRHNFLDGPTKSHERFFGAPASFDSTRA